MQDLESGISYMLNVEVATKPIIQGNEYLALRNFIGMLSKVKMKNKNLIIVDIQYLWV